MTKVPLYRSYSGLLKTALSQVLEDDRQPLSVPEVYSYRFHGKSHPFPTLQRESWSNRVMSGDVLLYHPRAGFKLGPGTPAIWDATKDAVHLEKKCLTMVAEEVYDAFESKLSFLSWDAVSKHTGYCGRKDPMDNPFLSALIDDEFQRSVITDLAYQETLVPMNVLFELETKNQRFPSMWFVEVMPALYGIRFAMADNVEFIGKLPPGYRSDVPRVESGDSDQGFSLPYPDVYFN